MNIKMSEYLQGAGISAVLLKSGQTVNILEPDGVYEVGDELAKYILENRKGVEVKDAPHYGAQKEPGFRLDEELFEQMAKESAAEETPEEEPIMTSKPRTKRGKK